MTTALLLGLALALCISASASLWAESATGEPRHGLPLLWDRIPADQRADFPLPYGFSIRYYHQNQTIDFAAADLVINGQPVPPEMAQPESVEESTNAVVARFDAWVLPFLNANVHAGRFSGSASRINVQTVLPLPIPASISYDGSNYGVGLTGAYAVKDYFLTYNYDWSWTRMDMIDGKGRSVDQGVRIGKRTNKWTAYTGWEKQEICGSRSGSATLEGGIPVHFSVRVMPVSAWTWRLPRLALFRC